MGREGRHSRLSEKLVRKSLPGESYEPEGMSELINVTPERTGSERLMLSAISSMANTFTLEVNTKLTPTDEARHPSWLSVTLNICCASSSSIAGPDGLEGEITSEKRPLKEGETMEWILLTGVGRRFIFIVLLDIAVLNQKITSYCDGRHQRLVRTSLCITSIRERSIWSSRVRTVSPPFIYPPSHRRPRLTCFTSGPYPCLYHVPHRRSKFLVCILFILRNDRRYPLVHPVLLPFHRHLVRCRHQARPPALSTAGE
jgi:hypothetical protein